MFTVYKYPVVMSEAFTIDAPQGAQFLSVQVQGGQPQLWVRVDTSRPMATYKLGVVGTGHEMRGGLEYMPHIGTFQLCDTLVFHLFGGIYVV